MKLNIFCGDYHWRGSLRIGGEVSGGGISSRGKETVVLAEDIPRYGDGEPYRYDPFDYLARKLLEKAKALGYEVTAEQILIDERWEHLQNAKAIEEDVTSER